MRKLKVFLIILPLFVLLAALITAQASATTQAAQGDVSGIYRGVSTAVQFDVSPPLRTIAPLTPQNPAGYEVPDRPSGLEGPLGPQDRDPLVQSLVGGRLIPAPSVTFNAFTGTSAPPDPNGDVGPNHYVAMANVSFAVYSKTGTLLYGPAANNTLWSGFGGACQNENAGDPIVLYDQLADRWLLTQFTAAGPTYYNCVALSTTGDPTGTYYRWAFSTGNNFPDYPKYGVWSNGYYISTREFAGGSTFVGVGAYALNRDQMLVGNASPQVISFLAAPGGAAYNVGDGLLPADLDGTTLPPAGSPQYYVGTMDNGASYGAPQDAITLWKFVVDWVTPGNSSFTLANTLNVAAFDSIYPCSATNSRACIPQPNTTNKVDILSYRQRPMFRLAYRNFGTHESLVTNQSVEAATSLAGVRWYELRSPNSSPVVYQQGTYAPGTTDGIHRWMGSIAMDKDGNMALGYSASAASVTFPSSWYTGRLAGDPLGTMPQGEGSFVNGTGSFTTNQRWGDYTAMTVDPVDDCTFWYINEYFVSNGSTWTLRVGSFKYPTCGGVVPTPTPTSPPTNTPTPTATPSGQTCTTYVSTDVPKTISSSGTPSVSSIISVPSGGTIVDVNVLDLNGTHTWINDLDFNLTSPAGTEVQIMAQSCSSQDNFDLNLDDEAAPGPWPCPPTGGGTYQPSNPLSTFDGQTSPGTWTLRIDDNANLDGGSLNGWSLEICTSGSAPTPTPTPPPTNTPTPPPSGNTGFLSPTSNAAVTSSAGDNNGYEVSPNNAHANDGVFAVDNNSGTTTATSCTSIRKDKHIYRDYNISIPGSVIDGIEVRLDGKVDSTTGSPRFCVQLSWNGGVSWTTAKSTANLTTSEATYILGGAADTWGHTWTVSELSNTNFRVRIIDRASSTARDFSLDWIAVQVTYH
ncbi:MAG: proprotein convertase P-domain-containing protein [Chloroflexota bacterium]